MSKSNPSTNTPIPMTIYDLLTFSNAIAIISVRSMGVMESEQGSTKGLTKTLITALGAGGIVVTAIAMPGAGYLYKEIQKKKLLKKQNMRRLKAAIKRLERQQVVSWHETGDHVTLTLTEHGRKKVLQYAIDDLTLQQQDKWDGYFRIVIFDIPEEKKVAREMLRKKLRELGFQKLQKSAFITRLECKNEIDFLRHNLEIAQHVTYILAREVASVV